MMACFCCLKKRGEVYILRNRQGIDNRHVHFQNSDESIAESEAERGDCEREEQRQICDQLQEWHAEQRAIIKELLKTKGFLKIFYFKTETLKVLTFPVLILMFMLRFLIILMLKMKCYELMCSW